MHRISVWFDIIPRHPNRPSARLKASTCTRDIENLVWFAELASSYVWEHLVASTMGYC